MAAQSKSLLKSYAFHLDTNQRNHDMENLLYLNITQSSLHVKVTQEA